MKQTAAALELAIRQRAEEIYVRSGRIPGRDLQNWAQAEAEIRRELERQNASQLRAIVVRVGGVQYVGEYDAAASNGYAPGEFAPGAAVPVRFQGQKMYVGRPNGRELETALVRQAS